GCLGYVRGSDLFKPVWISGGRPHQSGDDMVSDEPGTDVHRSSRTRVSPSRAHCGASPLRGAGNHQPGLCSLNFFTISTNGLRMMNGGTRLPSVSLNPYSRASSPTWNAFPDLRIRRASPARAATAR